MHQFQTREGVTFLCIRIQFTPRILVGVWKESDLMWSAKAREDPHWMQIEALTSHWKAYTAAGVKRQLEKGLETDKYSDFCFLARF